MRRVLLTSLILAVLSGTLSLAPASKAGVERHPLIRRAASALQAARTDLQNAAHDYCGHRLQALEASNAALNQLQQALACDSGRNNASTAAEPVEAAGDPAVPANEPHPNIYRAINALGAAEGDLQDAAHDYCGHRVAALGAVRSALGQLKLAIQCDRK